MDSSKVKLDHAETLYETIDESLDYLYEMAINKKDLADSEEYTYRYGEKEQINSGASKIIYKVFDFKTEREIAMACPKNSSESQLHNFSREALLTASLEHPNIIPVHDLGNNEQELPYFTMKLMKGDNLRGALRKELSLFKRLEIFSSVCEGLAYAHSKNVVHLDIKPANIQIGEFGEVLICDWGLAKILFSEIENDSASSPHLFNDGTLHGYIKGTPGFMAPEQANPNIGPKDKRTDIYALAGLLYFLMTGRAPVDGKGIVEILEKTQIGELNSFDPKAAVPTALQAVIHKGLASDPADRYQSIKEIQAEIDAFTNGFATSAENASLLRIASLFIKRHKTSSIFVLALVILSIIFVFRLSESEKNARKLLNLYSAEKQLTREMAEDVLPQFISGSKSALQSFNFKEYEQIINKAEKYAPMAEKVMNMKAAFLFYSQQFQEADQVFKKLKKPSTPLLAKLSSKYSKVKGDNERLKPEDFRQLLLDTQSYKLMRPLLGNERKGYTKLENYVNSVKVMFQFVNEKYGAINFNFYREGDLNCIDLSNSKPIRVHFSSLQKLPIHKLNVQGLKISEYNARYIATMPLEELNFATLKSVDLDTFLKIKTLKKITLPIGMYPDRDIKKLEKKMQVILISLK